MADVEENLDQGVPVDLRDTKANTYSLSECEESSEPSPPLGRRARARLAREEAARAIQKRKRWIMLGAFLPFLAGLAALGSFLMTGRTKRGGSTPSADAELTTDAGQGSAPPNPSPSLIDATVAPYEEEETTLATVSVSLSSPATSALDEPTDAPAVDPVVDEYNGIPLLPVSSPTAGPSQTVKVVSATVLTTTIAAPTTTTTIATTTETSEPTMLWLEDVGSDGVPEDNFPLGECQGDCDDDDDCQGALLCYQRYSNEAIPGCSGDGSTGTDYCSKVASPLKLLSLSSSFPLGMCQGDCDSDEECEGSLVCFQREKVEYIPGCSGQGGVGIDYCYHRPRNYLYESTTFPLGPCMGDCDSDEDCKGSLICEQRDGDKEIPGCQGNGVKDSDYCRYPNEADLQPSSDISIPMVGAEEVPHGNLRATASPTPEPSKRVTRTPTPAPSTAEPTCTAAGEKCIDKKLCCSGLCEHNADNEKVCGNTWTDPAPSDTEPTCSAAGEVCIDKKLCCSGFCEHNANKEKVCGNTLTDPAPSTAEPTCSAAGEVCIDKKLCCSDFCEHNADKVKVCGDTWTDPSSSTTEPTCSAAGEMCIDKKLCCSGSCEHNANKEKVCSQSVSEQGDKCRQTGELCIEEDCCSGTCYWEKVKNEEPKPDDKEEVWNDKIWVELCA